MLTSRSCSSEPAPPTCAAATSADSRARRLQRELADVLGVSVMALNRSAESPNHGAVSHGIRLSSNN
jgi:hypothetical protein